MSYSADGRYVASAGFDKNIIITDTLNLDNISVIKTLEHDDKVVSVKWHPFLPLLLSTSADKSARILKNNMVSKYLMNHNYTNLTNLFGKY